MKIDGGARIQNSVEGEKGFLLALLRFVAVSAAIMQRQQHSLKSDRMTGKKGSDLTYCAV